MSDTGAVKKMPVYRRIAEHYAKRILSDPSDDSHLPAGHQLPGIRQIADQHNVARETAVRAIRTLAEQNLVVSSTRGTFVASPERRTLSGSDRLTLLMSGQNGLRPDESVKLISASLIKARAEIAAELELAEGARVIARSRIYSDAAGINRVSTSYLPGGLAASCPELLLSAPLPKMTWGLVEERTSRRPVRRLDRAETRPAPEDTAVHLKIAPGTPVTVITNIYWDQHEVPLEIAIDYLAPGRSNVAEVDLTQRKRR